MQGTLFQKCGRLCMYKVAISPSANADLFNALKYIAYELENPSAAEKLADGVDRCYAALEEMPAAHELCRDPVLRRLGYRRYPVGNYIVIFRVVEEAQEVRVVHFFHATQDYLSIMKSEL